MTIKKITPFNFRNLKASGVSLSPEINFLIGDNGSGKSSFLEALFLMGHGKSYRTTSTENIICYQTEEFAVNAVDLDNNSYGVAKGRQGLMQLNINGTKRNKLSDIAQHFAIQVITPESFKLFFGGPKERRKFVDLGLFHVEQSYGKSWRDFNKVLKQRNAFLKSILAKGNTSSGIEVWNSSFISLSERLTEYRGNYIEKLQLCLTKLLEIFLPEVADSIRVSFHRGWKKDATLSDVLISNLEREIQSGFSQSGAHKFDLRFTINRISIDQCLSRGQQKLFLMALTLAQTQIIFEQTNKVPMILIDDIGAELDVESRTKLAKGLSQTGCQVVITAIDDEAIKPLIPREQTYKKFHVKHGVISELSEG